MGTLWLGKHETASISFQYCRPWRRGGLGFHENGGRRSNEVFDATLIVWKFCISFTLWGIRKWEPVFRFLPSRRDGNLRGLQLMLITPVGPHDDGGTR